MVTTNRRKNSSRTPVLPLGSGGYRYYILYGDGAKIKPECVPPEEWVKIIEQILESINPLAQYLSDFQEIIEMTCGDWPEKVPTGITQKTRVWDAAWISAVVSGNKEKIHRKSVILLTTKLEFVQWDYKAIYRERDTVIFDSILTALDKGALETLFTQTPNIPAQIIDHFDLLFGSTITDKEKNLTNLKGVQG